MKPRWIHLLGALVLLSVLTPPAGAQNDVDIGGIVDLVGTGQQELDWLNSNNTGDGNFDPLRARLFVDGRRDNTALFMQFLFSGESFSEMRLFGAYLLHKVFEGESLYLEAGLIPSHNGIWAANTYSDKNPLVGIPLSYYWKSTLPYRQMPNNLDDLLAHRGQGQTGINYADSSGVRGTAFRPSMPVLYDNCWNYGFYTMGAKGLFNYALGITAGTPSAPVASTNINDNITVNGRLGYVVSPGLQLWVSGAHGAYLGREVQPYLPPGKTVNDYMQTLFGLSADWKWSHLAVMGEVFYNKYDTPLRADGLRNGSGYVQGVYTVYPQWDISLRYDGLVFESVQNSAGDWLTWDQDIHRYEAGVMYRVTRDLRVKAVVQDTNTGDGFSSQNLIPALQVAFRF